MLTSEIKRQQNNSHTTDIAKVERKCTCCGEIIPKDKPCFSVHRGGLSYYRICVNCVKERYFF